MADACSTQRAEERPKTPAAGAAARVERGVSRASAAQSLKAG